MKYERVQLTYKSATNALFNNHFLVPDSLSLVAVLETRLKQHFLMVKDITILVDLTNIANGGPHCDQQHLLF